MRDRYPEDEKKYKWLPTLLDAYEIADEVNSELLKDKAKKGITIACSKGCHACCKRPSVPFTAPELMAISWFASEKLSGSIRSVVKQQLIAHETTTRCPFLVEGACSIYPVRPLACRQFFMAGTPCQDGEEVMESRPHDMVIPTKDGTHRVAMKFLEPFGITKPSEKLKAFNNGFIVSNSKQMHEYDWNRIADTMDVFDQET